VGTENPSLGRALRLIVSEGWADMDPDAVTELLEQARIMAELILAGDTASTELRTIAADFLERLATGTAR